MANKVFQLNTGCNIPLIGFGTFQIHGGDQIKKVLDIALSTGYRHIDTAVVYRNEQYIGEALKTLLPKYNLTRADIFITSKLIPAANRGEDYISSLVKESLRNLQTDYIDLYLIHWPGVSGIPVAHPDNAKYRKIVWKVLSEFQKNGNIRSIGVSNFTENHLKEILDDKTCVRPAVNQVEWHPHYHTPKLLEYCRSEKIFLQAYSSLGSSNYSSLRDDPVVRGIAKKLNKSAAQILLGWAHQQNIGVLPKGSSRDHIEQNFQLDFVIPEEDMQILSNMRTVEKYAWDPKSVA